MSRAIRKTRDFLVDYENVFAWGHGRISTLPPIAQCGAAVLGCGFRHRPGAWALG